MEYMDSKRINQFTLLHKESIIQEITIGSVKSIIKIYRKGEL